MVEEIDEERLDTAIALGDAVCNELGICCDKRGRVIFHIYQKLGDLKSHKQISSEDECLPNVKNES